MTKISNFNLISFGSYNTNKKTEKTKLMSLLGKKKKKNLKKKNRCTNHQVSLLAVYSDNDNWKISIGTLSFSNAFDISFKDIYNKSHFN